MINFIYIIVFFLITSLGLLTSEIKININSIQDVEKYDLVLYEISEKPIKISETRNSIFPVIMTLDKQIDYPTAVFLQITKLDSSESYAVPFEIDTNYIDITINKHNSINIYKGSNFQNRFSNLYSRVIELETTKKNGYKNDVAKTLITFLEENSSHPIAYIIVSRVLNDMNENDLRKISSLLNEQNFKNTQLKSVSAFLESSLQKRNGYLQGSTINNLSGLLSIENNKEVVYDLKKGSHLVYVWSTWCGPCIRKLKSTNKLKRNQDFNFVIISVDSDKEKWLKFAKQFDFENNFYSIDSNLLTEFKIDKLPFSLLIVDGVVKQINPELLDFLN